MQQSVNPQNDACAAAPPSVTINVRDWYGRILAVCQSRLVCVADAEDAVQETFVRALKKMDGLRDSASMGAWLRQIAHNVCVDFVRRQQYRRASPDVDHVEQPHLPAAEDVEERARLIRCLHELPEALREIILLHYFQEMTYDEMSDWLNIARSTVNERLGKARRQLRQHMLSGGTP